MLLDFQVIKFKGVLRWQTINPRGHLWYFYFSNCAPTDQFTVASWKQQQSSPQGSGAPFIHSQACHVSYAMLTTICVQAMQLWHWWKVDWDILSLCLSLQTLGLAQGGVSYWTGSLLLCSSCIWIWARQAGGGKGEHRWKETLLLCASQKALSSEFGSDLRHWWRGALLNREFAILLHLTLWRAALLNREFAFLLLLASSSYTLWAYLRGNGEGACCWKGTLLLVSGWRGKKDRCS